MHRKEHRIVIWFAMVVTALSCFTMAAAPVFSGHITVMSTRGGDVQTVIYAAATNMLRIERGETNWPHARNLVNRETGAITLFFPNNRSFVQLKASGATDAAPPPPMPAAMPAMPALPTAGALPAMPMIPQVPMEKLDLKATGEKTNLFGYACARYEITHRGETMEIWATDQLLPYQPWRQNQPPRFGPQLIEEQWGEMVKARKLFPLQAVLKFDNGAERLRFEVKTIVLQKPADQDGALFRPPADYQEIPPLPF